MEAVAVQEKEQAIQWKQLWSLAAMYGSIIIGWIAYDNYQPKLLIQFQFAHFGFFLAIAHAIILTITPPIAGRMGDRYRLTRGHRIPIISSGMSFAAMVFMAVAFTLFSNPGEIVRWIIPVLIVLWLTGMSIFTSPALSTIETFIPVEKLPRAMAVLTIVANLLYALEPVIVDIIDYVGAPVTFITGGAITFLSGYSLKKNMLSFFRDANGNEKEPRPKMVLDRQRSQYLYIFELGVLLGIPTAIALNIFPEILGAKVGELFNHADGKIILVGVLVSSGLLALPASNLVNVYGLNRSFWISCLLTAVSVPGILLFNVPVIVLIMLAVFSVGFAVLSVTTLPLAMQKSNYYEKVFCVGIFFSGVALTDGILNIVDFLK